jgi:hypothetical protein
MVRGFVFCTALAKRVGRECFSSKLTCAPRRY